MRKADKFLSGETLKYDIGPKLNHIVDRVNRDIKGDGKTIAVNELGNSICIQYIGSRGGGVGGGSSDYSGPFAVVKKDDTTVTVYGYNATAKRYFYNYVDIGIETPIIVAETDKTISSSAWVYLKIAYSSTYTITIETASTFPAQTNTELYIRLASVAVESSKISEIIQYHYGNVNLIGVS